MLLGLSNDLEEALPYACQEPGCLIRYDGPRGYFLDTKDTNIIGAEITPRVNCSNDGQRMYLAEVTPERRNFHRRKFLLSGVTSARYIRCPSLEQLTRGVISAPIMFVSFVSRKYPRGPSYRIRQPGSWQAYGRASSRSLESPKSISV